VLPDLREISHAADIAARIAMAVAEPLHLEGRELTISVSIGVAVGPDHGEDATELLRHANSALHQAKRNGRDRIEVFDNGLRVEMQQRIDAERSLRRAIDQGEVVPFFQPEVDATTGRIIGAEVLARWVRRDGTIVPATDLLARSVDAATLERLNAVLVHQARPVLRRLATFGLPAGFRFRINLPQRASARAWRDQRVLSMLAGLDPELITLDVTETAVANDLAFAAGTLGALRTRGVRICLEDVGRGSTTLGLLRSLPLDEVRIDRVALDAMLSHPTDRAIVRSLVALARDLGLTVSADGVETGAQSDALIALGCIRHQGHLHTRAVPAAELERMLYDQTAEVGLEWEGAS
jgi:predicted signal transduction protein with EAL and GGDEF domain